MIPNLHGIPKQSILHSSHTHSTTIRIHCNAMEAAHAPDESRNGDRIAIGSEKLATRVVGQLRHRHRRLIHGLGLGLLVGLVVRLVVDDVLRCAAATLS